MTTVALFRKLTTILILTVLLGVPPVFAGNAETATAAEAMEENVPPEPQPLEADEVEQLEARAEQPGEEVAGGALNTQQLTYIVIALAAAVIVLIVK